MVSILPNVIEKRSKRKRAKKRSSLSPVAVIVVLVCIIAFSLGVRWLDVGRRPANEETTFQIEVLNGTGETGVAMEMAMKLRKMGIDVLIVGDADRYDFDESILIDRRGNARLMAKLARLLGCRRIIQQIQERPLVDATFIIGKDKDSLKIGGS